MRGRTFAARSAATCLRWSIPAGASAEGNDRPNPGALKWLWRERRCSAEALDQSGVWRFRELLPILDSFGNAVSLREGNTPLYHLPRAAKALGIDQLFAKHQGMNPTGSFKDTGMTAALSVAKERGFEWVACASTGNTSAAMAAYAARAGLRSLVLIPEGKIAWGKLSQAMDYGAVTCQVKTDFDGCLRVLTEIVQAGADLSAELRESLSAGGAEDAGLRDCRGLGLECARPPDCSRAATWATARRWARDSARCASWDWSRGCRGSRVIQAAGANPLVRSLKLNHGAVLEPVEAHTRATAIRIGNPASWRKAARVIQESGGWCLDVTEAEIAIAKAEIGAEGLGCEPASAVTLAGLKKLRAQGVVRSGETVVLVLTGHTLKDADYTIDFHRGTLLTDEEKQGPRSMQIDALRRNAVTVDATPAAVLAAMKGEVG